MLKFILLSLCIIIGGFILVNKTQTQPLTFNVSKAHHSQEGFKNTAADFSNDVSLMGMLYRYINETRVDPMPTQAIPVKPLTTQQLNQLSPETDVVIRLGHSSIYLQIAGQKWLIDPVFSERASPFSFAGPKRFHQPPIDLALFDNIDGVLISHDHYDHLDKQSIKLLKNKVKHFVVPLGVDKHLKSWGVPAKKITALDWWEGIQIEGVTLTATPTQHFSGRTLLDKNKTLWASYVIQSVASNIYFSGDSGYFSGFKEIGEKFGPFDLTMIETGAYDKDWPTIHMTPEQSLQAHLDLDGKTMMPIHNGTFDLAFHSWYEPLQRIQALAVKNNVSLTTPVFGNIVEVNNIQSSFAWWQQLEQTEFNNLSKTAN